MLSIPDAPYIRYAERYGTDYTSRWYGFEETLEDDDEIDEEEDEYEYE